MKFRRMTRRNRPRPTGSLAGGAAALLALMALLAGSAHDGVAGASSQIGAVRYTALGDSVTWQNQYVAAYSAYAAADLHATSSTANLGTPGWMSRSLLLALQGDAVFRTRVAEADIVTIFIGLNDYQWTRAHYLAADSPYCPPPKETCMQAMVDLFASNWNEIIAEIRTLNGNPNVAIRALTIYNPYVPEDFSGGRFEYFTSFLDQMNAVILGSAAEGVLVADIHGAFNGADGAEDGTELGFFTAPDVLHPNAYGHQRIADELRALGYFELDRDGDGMLDAEADADGDGCADVEELGSSPLLGGLRDPHNAWDFYDVEGSQTVDAMDIGLVRVNFNPQGPVPVEDVIYDRSAGAARWAPGSPDNKINAIDIALVRASFNHSCQAPS